MTMALRQKAGNLLTRVGSRKGSDSSSASTPSRLPAQVQFLGILLLLTLVLSGAVVKLSLHMQHVEATAQARTDAVEAAKKHAKTILSYNYQTLETNIQRATAASTGQFKKEYEKNAPQLLKQAKNEKATVRAQVMATSVVRANPDQVVTLMFVNQVTVKKGQNRPHFSSNRVRLTLTEVDGDWLVSKLEAL